MTERLAWPALGPPAWTLNAPLALLAGVLAFLACLYGSQHALPWGDTQQLRDAQWQTVASHGFSAAPPTVSSAALPAAWQHSTLPMAPDVSLLAQAQANLQPGGTQTTWVRLQAAAPPTHSALLALYGVRVKTNGTVAVYLDGRLVHSQQRQGPLWNSNRTPLWVEINSADLPARGHELLIRLEHTRQSKVALSSLYLGPAAVLQRQHQLRLWLQQDAPMLLNGAFIAVGVFALCVWLRRREDNAYLLFFCLAATSFGRGLHFYSSQPIANDWFGWMTVNALLWMVTAVHVFMCQLHRQPLRWLTRSLFGLCLLMGLLTLPVWPWLGNSPTLTPLIYLLPALMGAVVAVVGGMHTWRVSVDGRLVAMGVGLCTLFGVADWLLQNNWVNPEGWYLGAYTNALTFMVFGLLMFRRYVGAIDEVRQINASLAERLRVREAELSLSHQRLRQAEMQQALGAQRQRLMQDMHDGLGSSLTSAIRSVQGREGADAWVSQVLQDCLDDLKLAIDSMEPVDADLLLLLATLRFRLEPRLESAGIRLQWLVEDMPALHWLDPSAALHILRILQESIANVLRHTRASTIVLRTALDGQGVCVTVADDGAGFDVAAALARNTGRGLNNQQRRAAAIGARLSWDSGARGTLFRLWLPLQRPPGTGPLA